MTRAHASTTTASAEAAHTPPAGTVAFVGAGPGDPGLLTVRATRLLAAADLVVLSHQDPGGFLAAARPDVEVLLALDPAGEPLEARACAKLLVDAAKKGKRVVRLIDGDPMLYSSAPEEALGCAKAGVMFEFVPGVATASAVPGYAGVPLTNGTVREVRLLAGDDRHADWASAAASQATLVVVNPVPTIVEIVEALLAGGRAARTPCSVTSAGTTREQRTVVAPLDQIAAEVKGQPAGPDVVMVVGQAVAHQHELAWWETKPLYGWRVLVPRTKEQAGALSEQLIGYGAVPEEVPTISVEPPRTPQQMERAVKGLVTGRYQWVAFTSANAVKAVRERFEEYGLDARAFAGIKVAAVGETTAGALRAFGVKPDLMPSGEQSAAGLLADWPAFDPVFDPLDRVLLPRADIATDTLVAGLIELGWEVDDVTAYRTVRAAPPPAPVREAIKGGGFDAVLFTSSSTVRNLVGIAGKPHASTVVAVIGPNTARTAEEHGLRVDVIAPTPSVRALATALAEHAARLRQSALDNGEAVWRPTLRRGRSRPRAK